MNSCSQSDDFSDSEDDREDGSSVDSREESGSVTTDSLSVKENAALAKEKL